MKKIFTLALALMGFAGVANAANVDDLAVLKQHFLKLMRNGPFFRKVLPEQGDR